MSNGDARREFWARTRRLTLVLAAAWLTVTLGVPWFARELDTLSFFGFPLGWWLASEGTLLAYLAIIVAYAVGMERLERRFLSAIAGEPPS